MELSSEKIKAQKIRIAGVPEEELPGIVDELREGSWAEVIPDIVARWHGCRQPEIKKDLFNFLTDLKAPESLPFLMACITSQRYEMSRPELLSVIWQSGLDASDYLDDIIEIALTGDFLSIIEVISIIDSIDNSFSEDQIMELVYNIQERIDEEGDSEKANILGALRESVQSLSTQ